MRLALASDHRGFELKSKIAGALQSDGHTVTDLGCSGPDPVDYPDYATAVCGSISEGQSDLGILICASGIGMSIAANKYGGIRAAVCCNADMAGRSRRHNDANVLCLGSDFVSGNQGIEITRAFVSSSFEGGRHQRRLDKIAKTEQR